MPGETDLDAMLRHLTVTVRPGRYHHDHLLVPVGRVLDAVACLARLRDDRR